MRATPSAIGWLQRALRHEFAAARQFALQAAVARSAGALALAETCAAAVLDEVRHASLLAQALADCGAGFAEGAPPSLPIGAGAAEIAGHARATEQAAVRLYQSAARACAGLPELAQLFEAIGAEEARHAGRFAQSPAVTSRWPGDATTP